VSIKNALKDVVKSLPPFKSLVSHRNQLLRERDKLLAEVLEVRSAASCREESIATAIHDGGATIGFAPRTTQEVLQAEIDRLHGVVSEREEALRRNQEKLVMFGEGPPFVPNGHYYSPIAPKSEIERDDAKLFADYPDFIPGVDLGLERQLSLLQELRKFYDDLPFTEDKQEGLRYHYLNPSYGFSDGIFLNAMLRHVRPARVIEVGSGFTSAMFLDTNERWLDNHTHLTFIEPYPDLLYSLLRDEDREQVVIHSTRLQDVELEVFDALEAGDILFIDSTHVSRVGSDVNYIFFEILPRLKSGVFVHFHDIFFPFEYPRIWILEGRAWNEIYLLRSFLQFNNAFEIVLFNTFLEVKFRDYFLREMPLCLKNPGGSLWLRKL
jgi:predicted O-methyltransferase YrrM